jgi:hypothetical protein
VSAPCRGNFPCDDARLLQGTALPRFRISHPRHASRAGHAPDGNLRKYMPITRTMCAGWLAICDCAVWAFFFKDEILEGLERQHSACHPGPLRPSGSSAR